AELDLVARLAGHGLVAEAGEVGEDDVLIEREEGFGAAGGELERQGPGEGRALVAEEAPEGGVGDVLEQAVEGPDAGHPGVPGQAADVGPGLVHEGAAWLLLDAAAVDQGLQGGRDLLGRDVGQDLLEASLAHGLSPEHEL